jgi:exodeoxyribonuclease V alpha subunit
MNYAGERKTVLRQPMTGEEQMPAFDPTAGFTPFDIHFSRFIAALDDDGAPAVRLAAALLSRMVRQGDSCLDLAATADKPAPGEFGKERTPPLSDWILALRASKAVGRPEQLRPLILDAGNRLYLYRYWQYEKRLADNIRQRLSRPPGGFDPVAREIALNRYFPVVSDATVDWQKSAADMALSKTFCVITGGPGTGKTFTIARILALICDLHKGPPLRIHLAAPTGKAAAQLRSSVRAAKSGMALSSPVENCIPEDVFTLHRLLKVRPDRYGFYHHADNRLPTDLLVVDEASMVDLALMSKLVAALPDSARLILTGDRDQLASVEAGSVFGDICGQLSGEQHGSGRYRQHRKACGGSTPEGLSMTEAASAPMIDAISVLYHNFRFDAGSGLGALSEAVKAGKPGDAFDLLTDPDEEHLTWIDYQKAPDIARQLSTAVLDGFAPYLASRSAAAALASMPQFQILAALRRGPYGADGINRLAETVLARQRLIQPDLFGAGNHYHGRPVIISQNDYGLQLFNGDLGVVWAGGENRRDALRVYFTAPDGSARNVLPQRLPAHETVFAMTVHKSQGSEFDHVMLFLPPRDTELLTRELVYTALTRARRRVTVWAPRAVLRSALKRRLARSSGLRDALWGGF